MFKIENFNPEEEAKTLNLSDRQFPSMMLRLLGAILLYLVLNPLLKLPFDKEFLAEASLASLLIRTGRYAIIIFLITGVYPKIFPLFERKGLH